MKRLTQSVLVGMILLAGLSLATAQQTPQPVVRLGNFIEVGNELFMHIIATSDIRYATNHNIDFEDRIRDRAQSRATDDTAVQVTSDLMWVEARFGVDMRYQKSLTFQLLLEQQSVLDGNLIDSTGSDDSPGGNDVFGRGEEREDQGIHVERFWLRYKFPGTPVSLFAGAALHKISQAGILGNDDPGIGLELDLGNFELWATVYVERESQRLGLVNDNDLISYVFGGAYTLKPHRFGFDVVYFRDRFFGADTAAVGCGSRGGLGCTGQKSDSVWVNASWTGRVGPVRGLVQGNVLLGTARGGTVGLPAGVPLSRDYDIFAGGVIAYAEAELGFVRPFVGVVFGSADGNPRDDELHGFAVQPQDDSTQVMTGLLGHLDKTAAAGTRDFSCPAQFRGVRSAPEPGGDPYAIGTGVTAASAGGAFAECYHSVSNVFNARLGRRSHVGIVTTYSNPGTLLIPVGLRVFPLKGHEITGWYVYRGVVDTSLLEVAFAPEIRDGVIGGINKTLYHEVGGFWMWTLNPHFDIRLAGSIGIPGEGGKDLARLADCNPTAPGRQACQGEDLALRGEARLRARF